MGRIKTTDPSITVVKIEDLRITGEDEWRLGYIQKYGDSVFGSPEYMYLATGSDDLLKKWLGDYAEFRKGHLIGVYKHVSEFGQLKPIKIYKDMRINTGHKRAAALASLGKETVKAIIVPDDTKL